MCSALVGNFGKSSGNNQSRVFGLTEAKSLKEFYVLLPPEVTSLLDEHMDDIIYC